MNGIDINVLKEVEESIAHQQWLDEMNANCEEYLPYERDFYMESEEVIEDYNVPF